MQKSANAYNRSSATNKCTGEILKSEIMSFIQKKINHSINLAKAGQGEYCLLTKIMTKNNGSNANQKANKHVNQGNKKPA